MVSKLESLVVVMVPHPSCPQQNNSRAMTNATTATVTTTITTTDTSTSMLYHKNMSSGLNNNGD